MDGRTRTIIGLEGVGWRSLRLAGTFTAFASRKHPWSCFARLKKEAGPDKNQDAQQRKILKNC